MKKGKALLNAMDSEKAVRNINAASERTFGVKPIKTRDVKATARAGSSRVTARAKKTY